MKQFFQKVFNWEKWPYDVLYAPLSVVWLYYGIKARHFWFFTPVNPSLVFAGFEGGSKKEMFDNLPQWSYPITLLIDPAQEFSKLRCDMEKAGLKYPLVGKPDTGMQGVLFRVIRNDEQLKIYHSKAGEPYILQTFVEYPYEFSVFHIRYPGETKGKITGLIVKDYLHVTGDGKKTLGELAAIHPFAKIKLSHLEEWHRDNWKKIIPAGEKYILNVAGNHAHGAKFVNLNKEIDQQLCDVFDKLSMETGQYYFGRYDLKCTSLEDLKKGINIQVLEYNGAGAAITHIFDRNMGYFRAMKEIADHWKDLYRIGKINNKQGVPYWSFMQGWRFMQKAKKNFKRMRATDKTFA